MGTEEAELRIAWRRAVGHTRASEQRFAALVARHAEAHRRYHNLKHVAWVVRHVHELAVSESIGDRDAVVVAACYHDAVYDPTRSDNEAASARLAAHDLTELAWLPERVGRVTSMIEATGRHLFAGDDVAQPGDAAVLLDADLAVLAAAPSAYQAYADGVRAEYQHLDESTWRAGRRHVLAALLARPTIFTTATARERWEARARANLAAELANTRIDPPPAR